MAKMVLPLFMPPTLKKWGHSGFDMCVCVCASYPIPYPTPPLPYPHPPHTTQPYPLRIQTHAHNQASCSRATLSCDSSYYAPNFEKVDGAYCFWSVR